MSSKDGFGRPPDLAAARAHWRGIRRGRPQQAEQAGPGEESVWDYPRPPRLEASRRVVRVVFEGRTIAESGDAFRVLETASPPVYYLPRDAIAPGLLQESDLESFCEWKGVARYHHLQGENRRVENAGWSYPSPDRDFAALRDHIAFYPGRIGGGASDGCFLGDERVRPQDGPFYGGWVTDDIKGPFKGSPGTEGW